MTYSKLCEEIYNKIEKYRKLLNENPSTISLSPDMVEILEANNNVTNIISCKMVFGLKIITSTKIKDIKDIEIF